MKLFNNAADHNENSDSICGPVSRSCRKVILTIAVWVIEAAIILICAFCPLYTMNFTTSMPSDYGIKKQYSAFDLTMLSYVMKIPDGNVKNIEFDREMSDALNQCEEDSIETTLKQIESRTGVPLENINYSVEKLDDGVYRIVINNIVDPVKEKVESISNTIFAVGSSICFFNVISMFYFLYNVTTYIFEYKSCSEKRVVFGQNYSVYSSVTAILLSVLAGSGLSIIGFNNSAFLNIKGTVWLMLLFGLTTLQFVINKANAPEK